MGISNLFHLTHFQYLHAISIGSLIVMGIHATFNISIRKGAAASAFYRNKPAVTNVAILIRECGLVALSFWFAAARLGLLFLAYVLYAGRLDCPFLDESVGQIGRFRIDKEPYIFLMDILQHEAHRHPYIERLGVMYLLKLGHRDAFCTFAGSSWRLIFVYVLMPWLSKYRSIRRLLPELKDDMNTDSSALLSPPVRAVTLLDPQAFALRAASLVPLAHDSIIRGHSTYAFGGPLLPMMSDELSLLQDNLEDENRELREENRSLFEENWKLRMQLRLTNLTPATATLNRDTRPMPNPVKCRKSPGFELDIRGPLYFKGQGTRSSELENEVVDESLTKQLQKPEMKREESDGLAPLQLPNLSMLRDDVPHAPQADFSWNV